MMVKKYNPITILLFTFSTVFCKISKIFSILLIRYALYWIILLICRLMLVFLAHLKCARLRYVVWQFRCNAFPIEGGLMGT